MTVSRRSLVKGTAWSAPVILSSTVVPAYAASTCDKKVNTVNNVVGSERLYGTEWYKYIKYVLGIAGTDANQPITSITVQLPENTTGLEVGFSPYKNAEYAERFGYTPVPHTQWQISEDKRTATYVGPSLPQPNFQAADIPLIWVKGFDAIPSNPTEEDFAKNQELIKVRDMFRSWADNYSISVIINGHADCWVPRNWYVEPTTSNDHDVE